MVSKLSSLVNTLQRAHGKFCESLSFPDTEPMRESTIQRFEYTFELAWKLMGAILAHQGIEAYGARTVIREAGRLGLISDTNKWLVFADARNLTSHVYKEETARQVYETAKCGFDSAIAEILLKAQQYF